MERFRSEEFWIRAVVVTFLVGVIGGQMGALLKIPALQTTGLVLMAPISIAFALGIIAVFIWLGCDILYRRHFRLWSARAILQRKDAIQAVYDLKDYLARKHSIQHYKRADTLMRIAWSLSRLRSEVNSGTLQRYLSTAAGNHFHDTRKLMALIKADATVTVLDKILQYYGTLEENRDQRKSKMLAMEASDKVQYRATVRALTDELSSTFPDAFQKAVNYLRNYVDDLENA